MSDSSKIIGTFVQSFNESINYCAFHFLIIYNIWKLYLYPLKISRKEGCNMKIIFFNILVLESSNGSCLYPQRTTKENSHCEYRHCFRWKS